MRLLIKSCLQTAHDSSRTSIAIPAIGTGNLRVPADTACWVMYDELDKFSQNNAATSLKDVRFVVYDKDPPSIVVRSLMFTVVSAHHSEGRHFQRFPAVTTVRDTVRVRVRVRVSRLVVAISRTIPCNDHE